MTYIFNWPVPNLIWRKTDSAGFGAKLW